MRANHFLAAVAALLLAGCAQNEIMEVSPDAHPAVGFDVYTGVQNRGTVTDNSVTSGSTGIKAKGFGILAYYTGQDNWTAKGGNLVPNFMWNQSVTWNTAVSPNAWTYNPVKYWPNTNGDKLSFFAYAPYSGTQSGTGTNGIIVSAKSSTAKPTITFTLQSAPDAMVDLVTTYHKDVVKQASAVLFNLDHVLSRANFKAKVEQSLAGSPTHIFVTGMRILGTASQGTGGDASGPNNSSKFYDKATYEWDTNTWNYTAAKNAPAAAYELGGTGSVMKKTSQTGVVTGYTTQGIHVEQAATETDLFTTNQYLFLIPPADNTGISSANDVRVQIDYDIVTIDANVKDGFTKTSTKATVSLPNGTLKRRSAYDFIFTIGLEKVQVRAEVIDWAEPTVNTPIPSVDATAASAAAIGTAITAMHTTKQANPNCNYFIVNINAAYSGALSPSATTTYFKPGDKIELNFKVASTVNSVSLSGWTASPASLSNSVGKIILTKTN